MYQRQQSGAIGWLAAPPAPQRTLERKKWGDGWREEGERTSQPSLTKSFFLLNFVVKRTGPIPKMDTGVGKSLKWIRKSRNVMGNLVNWILRKSYCAVFGGADG